MAVSANPFLVPKLVRGHGGFGAQTGRARAQGFRASVLMSFRHKDGERVWAFPFGFCASVWHKDRHKDGTRNVEHGRAQGPSSWHKVHPSRPAQGTQHKVRRCPPAQGTPLPRHKDKVLS